MGAVISADSIPTPRHPGYEDPVPMLLLLLFASGPVEERFVLTVQGVPMAVLRVAVREGTYEYESTHFLDEGDERFERVWVLGEQGDVEGLVPEVLFLLRVPPAGCRQVLEERRGIPETLCVDESTAERAVGRVDEVPFTASYDDGHLSTLALPLVRWSRLTGPLAHGQSGQLLFSQGFEVAAAPGPPRLEPPVPGTRRVTAAVRGTGKATEVGRRRCLPLARSAIDAEPALKLVLGLVVEDGRAYPHAWVRRGAQDEDPSLLAADHELLERRTYLELPREAAGRVYLELLGGTRQIRGVKASAR